MIPTGYSLRAACLTYGTSTTEERISASVEPPIDYVCIYARWYQAIAFGKDAYPSLDAKAAALLHSLARNHALIDGNKRLGLAAVIAFYGLNGRRLTLTNDQAYDLVMKVFIDDDPAPRSDANQVARTGGWCGRLPRACRGRYPARAGGPWLCRTLVLFVFQATVVPSG